MRTPFATPLAALVLAAPAPAAAATLFDLTPPLPYTFGPTATGLAAASGGTTGALQWAARRYDARYTVPGQAPYRVAYFSARPAFDFPIEGTLRVSVTSGNPTRVAALATWEPTLDPHVRPAFGFYAQLDPAGASIDPWVGLGARFEVGDARVGVELGGSPTCARGGAPCAGGWAQVSF